MNSKSGDDRRSAAADCYPSVHGGVWYPLGGKLEGKDCAWIMFHGPRRSSEPHEACELRFNKTLIDYGIQLEDGMLMSRDFERFREAMEKEGWSNEFIAFGP